MITSKIKVLGLLGLPLLAIAVAVMVFAFNPGTDSTEAATPGAAMRLEVGGESGKADVRIDSTFKVSVIADGIPLPAGYILVQAWLEYGATGLTFQDSATTWPDCDAADLPGGSATAAARGCLTAIFDPPASFEKGELFTFNFNCPNVKGSHTIDLLAEGTAPANTNGALFTEFGTAAQIVPSVQGIDINCVNAPTDTPTNTPPPIPKMSKNPSLSNHWLVRQGTKIPPADCLAGTPTTLTEDLSQAIVSRDPKADPLNTGDKFQQLAAFEFEVHYDATKVCVDLTVGDSFFNVGATCLVEDSESKPQLEGVARIGCFTQGKGHEISSLDSLATVDVYPQPEVYSQAKPNQFNGVVVQINNVACDLGDEQGNAIPIFSCDDADITFRYLEGDVEPSCVIDATDAQAVSFRWGAEKGSLIYNDFLNLEPGGGQADNDIDINDIQFVFGRFGSTCVDPHPPQDPVNPKALPTPEEG